MDGAPHRIRATSARRLRVAVVTETYLPEVNGVAMTMGHLVRGLCARGHRVELVRPRQRPAEIAVELASFEEVLVRGVAIPRYDALKVGLPARALLLRRWSMRRPDVVHLVTEGPLGWSALEAARALDLPVVSDFHTNFHAYTSHYGIGWLKKPVTAYLRRFHNRTQATLVPTADLRDELDRLGFRNLQIVARGVDTTLFNPGQRSDRLRAEWRAAWSDPVALFVSRLAPEKNLTTMLETFETMRQANARVKLVVVGDGPERTHLEARYRDAIFAGARYGSDLAAHYASADIFLFPSLTETYGNVTVEALASGLAVIAYRYAAAAQHIVDGENGITVPRGDRQGFVRAAVGLALQSELRMRMGEKARACMARVDWSEIVHEFENTLMLAAASAADPRYACA
jgi:glycosyltransferase involved in cell wall biosynthesis